MNTFMANSTQDKHTSFSLDSIYLDEFDNIFNFEAYFYIGLTWSNKTTSYSYGMKVFRDALSPRVEWTKKLHFDEEEEEFKEEIHGVKDLFWNGFIVADPTNDTSLLAIGRTGKD